MDDEMIKMPWLKRLHITKASSTTSKPFETWQSRLDTAGAMRRPSPRQQAHSRNAFASGGTKGMTTFAPKRGTPRSLSRVSLSVRSLAAAARLLLQYQVHWSAV